MVNRKRHEQGHESCFVNKFRKLWNLPGKSFQGVLSSIFASFTAVMSICLNDGSMRLGSGMTPVFLKISLVLRTISTCSLVDSLSVIHSSTPSKPVSYPTTRRAKYPQVIRIVVWRVSIYVIDRHTMALRMWGPKSGHTTTHRRTGALITKKYFSLQGFPLAGWGGLCGFPVFEFADRWRTQDGAVPLNRRLSGGGRRFFEAVWALVISCTIDCRPETWSWRSEDSEISIKLRCKRTSPIKMVGLRVATSSLKHAKRLVIWHAI